MKIERHQEAYTKPISIQQFADDHNLVMQVHERSLVHRTGQYPLARFYVHFAGVELRPMHGILSGVSGNADTEEAAIAEYAELISGKTITTDGGKTEIQVPILAPYTP